MFQILKIDKIHLNERILALYCNKDIYLGLGNKFLNYSKQKILCIHEKSVRNISGNDKYIGCSSYDGTGTVFDIDGKYIDKIEGPDTEIKGIAFDGNFLAVTTRGKTTWILENLEISKILDDHTQDVKGCKFHKKRLYTWSYDNTLKIYDLFEIDHSWELSQSIDFNQIVWNICFFNEYLCVCLHNGDVVIMKQNGYLWEIFKTIEMSVVPIYSCVVTDKHAAFVCNRNVLLVLDSNLEKVAEIPNLSENGDIFAASFLNEQNYIVTGSEDGILSIIHIEE